jgi:hypothetical protein
MLPGRGTVKSTRSASESCPSPRSGTLNDFGVDESDSTMLVVCFVWGSKNLIRGLVNKPNTWPESNMKGDYNHLDHWHFIYKILSEKVTNISYIKENLKSDLHNCYKNSWEVPLVIFIPLRALPMDYLFATLS